MIPRVPGVNAHTEPFAADVFDPAVVVGRSPRRIGRTFSPWVHTSASTSSANSVATRSRAILLSPIANSWRMSTVRSWASAIPPTVSRHRREGLESTAAQSESDRPSGEHLRLGRPSFVERPIVVLAHPLLPRHGKCVANEVDRHHPRSPTGRSSRPARVCGVTSRPSVRGARGGSGRRCTRRCRAGRG